MWRQDRLRPRASGHRGVRHCTHIYNSTAEIDRALKIVNELTQRDLYPVGAPRNFDFLGAARSNISLVLRREIAGEVQNHIRRIVRKRIDHSV